MQPYLQPVIQGNLTVTLKLMNDLPEVLNCDWKIYQEILFHIIQNAIKFSNADSEIKISVLYCPLQKIEDQSLTGPIRTVSGNVRSQKNSSTSHSSTSLGSSDMRNLGYLLTVVQDQGGGICESKI